MHNHTAHCSHHLPFHTQNHTDQYTILHPHPQSQTRCDMSRHSSNLLPQMDPSLPKTLEQLLDQIIQWIRLFRNLPWRTSTPYSQEQPDERKSVCQLIPDLLIVRDHASFLDIRLFMETQRGYQNSYANLQFSKADRRRVVRTRNSKFALEERGQEKWVVSFLEDLKEVFKVPKLNHPTNLLVGGFMDFLLQLLDGKPHLFAFEADLLITKLRSFITIFHDTLFQTTENDGHVHTLVSQFEILASETGILVHSFIFSPHPPPFKKIDELLSEPTTLLKANIIQFFNSSSYIINTTRNTLHFAMSSAFIVDSLLYDLENLLNQEDDSILEVKDSVEKLHRSLKHSWSLLSKHSNKTDEVKEIVLLAFTVEYLINYFLCGDAPAWYLALRLPDIIQNVERIGTRLRKMVRENHDVDRVLEVGDDFARLSLQTRINSGVDDTVDEFKYGELKILDTMVGFEHEELKILGELFGGANGLLIISIIGMAGLGKTTLAKKMYNHPTVRERFDKISWCTVSQEYQEENLLFDILKDLDSQGRKATLVEEREDDVGVRVYKTLKGRRYFIVVDDIWESRAWEDIKRYFPNEQNGSRILFTSRNKEVVDQCNSSIHALPLLSHEQCWELLKKKIFHGQSCPPELQHTGETIAAQCSGLPLVVVVVAGVLSTMKKDLIAWENVRLTLDSYILSYQDRVVERSLELSYMYLPHHLKPCFLYFGRFQEDEQIHVKKVTQLWIAEGFILADEEKRVMDTAKEYLKELTDKNLLMVVAKNYAGQAKVCIMHDLLRDMCLKIVEDENFLKVVDSGISFHNHHVQRMISQSSYNASLQPYGKYIRTFASTGRLAECLNVGNMKVLRVLDTIGLKTHYLVGIENLIHLRYWSTDIMPEPLSKYSNLEFLIVRGDIHISSSLLDGLPKLRYLSADQVYVCIDCNTSRTYDLEYISKVSISSQKDVQQFKAFPCIHKLVCEYNDSECFNFDFSSLTQLESLTLSDSQKIFNSFTFCDSSGIIEFKLPSNITKLSLSFGSLSCEQMSRIGALPNLEVLKLVGVRYYGEIWETRDDEFQKLRYLKLANIEELVRWNVSSWEHLPVLQQLIITGCHNLEEISSEIRDIPTLQLISVINCNRSMRKSVVEIEEQLKEEGDENVTIVVK